MKYEIFTGTSKETENYLNTMQESCSFTIESFAGGSGSCTVLIKIWDRI